MREPTDIEKAWASGFIDGEGSIFIGRSNWGTFNLYVSASQKTPEPLIALREMFDCGRLYRLHPDSAKAGQWIVLGWNARQILLWLVPHLRVKKGQAELAIQFQERKPPKGKRYPNTGVSLVEDESFYLALKDAHASDRMFGSV